MQPIRSVKGTRDILPPETALWNAIEVKTRECFESYNFSEIRTPIIEAAALFARSVGADTDIVGKEMYTFEDRDHESLTLRPEATASVVRAYIERALYNEGRIHKLYYIGPMFRRERPQKGRYRQFFQIGAEVLGSNHPAIDGETLEMLVLFLEKLGIYEHQLLVNSVGCPQCRKEYLRVLRKALEGVSETMCADCRRRAQANPLRVLDCKVEADQPIIEKLPRIIDYLCPECRQHFEAVKQELDERGIEYAVTPRLVRGLDYYTRTTFEITSSVLGAQNALLGGGRYDGLSEMLGGPAAPGFGFAIGEDRLALAVEQAKALQWGSALDVYVVWFGETAQGPALRLARELRAAGVRTEIGHEAAKMKKSLGLASKLGARFAVIIGESEVATGRYQVKDMTSSEQKEIESSGVRAWLDDHLVRPPSRESQQARREDLSE